MKIKIVCVGELKEKYFKDAIAEYTKRLSRYCSLEIKEVAQSKIDDATLSKKQEENAILEALEGYVITCEIDGEQMSSEHFAKKLNEVSLKASTITFVVGGSHGLSPKVSERASYKWSFSKLTFAHQLFRVNLLEQVYRGYCILNHVPYHK